jgi:diadenosine tetraphosphate (Ap4A) HIT family hydrolase
MCKSCETAVDAKKSVKLPGGLWSANHYGGSEGFFGWLALQPIAHRRTLAELTRAESRALGPAIRMLENGIDRYWRERRHRVERVYVMYFLEGLLEPGGDPSHLHFHLVPRFEALGPSMSGKTDVVGELVPGIDAYLIGKLRPGHPTYPLPSWLDRHAFKAQHGAQALESKELEIVQAVVR